MSRRLPLIVIALAVIACLGLFAYQAESEIPVDRLYALHLGHVPTDADWQRALPRLVLVRGGQKNAPKRLGDIDEDSVHTSTASCHHGSSVPEPVSVDMRAFYTDQDLYLRLEWSDATRDNSMQQWTFDGTRWQAGGMFEDGFGLLWDARGTFPRFSCSHACHISDFDVSGDNFHARNRMQLARPGTFLDLWNWKAGRTGRLGFVDDRTLDDKGMHGDVQGELFRPNSTYFLSGSDKVPFSEGDMPLLDAAGEEIESKFRAAGSTAPGYLTDQPVGSRADVSAHARYQDGRWCVTLHRRLNTGDPRDVVFLPGDESGVAFGLSLMDNTLAQHFASRSEERLVLMSPGIRVEQGEN